MDDSTVKLGLLMEAAQQHQHHAEASLGKLELQLRDLDDTVRQEVRRVLQGELLALSNESRRLTDALSALRRAAHSRIVLASLIVTIACASVAVAVAAWVIPSQGEIARMQARRDSLARAIVALEARGASLDLRRCGPTAELCVRVDRDAPTYGPAGDYAVIKGE